MNRILITSISKYPNGNAGAIRQHSLAKIYLKLGYEVVVIGLGVSTNFQTQIYDGVQYVSFRSKKNTLFSRILNILMYKSRLKRYLKNNPKFSKILVVTLPVNCLFFIKKYVKREKIELLHDSVEWYSPEEFPFGRYSLSYIINNLYNTLWIDNNFKVIAISKYLQNHFLSRGIHTIRIPVIMDTKKISYNKKILNDKTVLVYAGTIGGKKDYLKEIIDGLALLSDDERNKIELRIFGVNKTDLRKKLNISEMTLTNLSSTINCFGKVSREIVLKNLEEANFTVLLRSSTQRYAKAGFPTKVVESLASATPIILNITSDLGDYLYDMENSIVVQDCTSTSFCSTLKKVLKLSLYEQKEMQIKSRITAEKYFDYNNFIDEIKFF